MSYVFFPRASQLLHGAVRVAHLTAFRSLLVCRGRVASSTPIIPWRANPSYSTAVTTTFLSFFSTSLKLTLPNPTYMRSPLPSPYSLLPAPHSQVVSLMCNKWKDRSHHGYHHQSVDDKKMSEAAEKHAAVSYVIYCTALEPSTGMSMCRMAIRHSHTWRQFLKNGNREMT